MQRRISLVILGLLLMLFSSAVGVAANALGGQVGPDSPSVSQYFEDVPNTNPFYANVSNIYESDLVSGYNCGNPPAGVCQPGNLPYYLPFANITRGQMAKIIDNARTRPGIDVRTTADTTPYDARPLSSRTSLNNGTAIYGAHTNTAGGSPAILGETASSSLGLFFPNSIAVQGVVSPTNGGSYSTAVYGVNRSTTGGGIGVYGSQDGSGWGVFGQVSDDGRGVYGTAGNDGYGVYGNASTNGIGVYGQATGASGWGVYGVHTATGAGAGAGVFGETKAGIFGIAIRAKQSGLGYGLFAESTNGFGVWAAITNTTGTGSAIYGETSGPAQHAGEFVGDITVSTGCTGCAFSTYQIDDPTDPANSILTHASVSSPERLNVYNGNVTTDASGKATVSLPSYFQALNKDFRYQLTVIGGFAQAVVAQEVVGNKFVIATDKPNTKVSWQVTGVRNDPLANAKPVVVEQPKSAEQKGKYLYPEGYGQPASERIRDSQGLPKPGPAEVPADKSTQGVVSESK